MHKLQLAVRTNDYQVFQEYSKLVNEQLEQRATLRGLLGLKLAPEPVPLEEVEDPGKPLSSGSRPGPCPTALSAGGA